MNTYVLPLMCYGGYPALRSAEARALAELTNQIAEENTEILVAVRDDGKNREVLEFDRGLSRYVPMLRMVGAFVGADPLGPLGSALRLPQFFGNGDILVLIEEGHENAARLYVDYIIWMHGRNTVPTVTFKTFRIAIPWHVRWWSEYIVLSQVAVLAQSNMMSSLLHA